MKKVKIGIIGCGGIANGKHMPAYKALADQAEMVAFCDIIEERALKAKKEYGDKNSRTYTDYKELLKEKKIDMVCVCTPNISHSEITVVALNAGKHVMCEKPMAINYEEAKKMIDAKNRSGKLLTIGYQNRYRAEVRYLKEEAESGTFGDIYFARAKAVRRRAVPTWGVFLDEEKQGGGPLIDIGTHSLDITLYVMNNYKPKYAVGSVYHKLNKDTQTGNIWGDWDTEKFTVEDSAFGFVVMENGATISVDASWALNYANPGEAQTLICGTKAGADMEVDGTKLRINGVKNGRQYITVPDFSVGAVDFFEGNADLSKPHVYEAQVFLNAINGKGKLVVEPEQAIVVTRILDAIYFSAKTGKPVYFD